ncbi:NAD(P)-dependent oxidoreductase [Nocardia sp. CDC153]|uniref:NAD-dependent epimerase/dehydratase family protein n=1 Tax=Nocardia sp. CDC153 TaxID=3112167 RepID=UPI002DBBC517|nr:NAD(P)-dependent oxidoreductase [Nocardia sp. CDC153]MEC3954970.1 NAD(P)-dependent oxidoreductase [Nocardia sp. CDC153]
MRVLLTGAAGYLGSHVHRALLAAGHEVIAIDALLATVHGPDPVLPEDVSRVDLRDPDALEPLLGDVDVVCHLAAAVPMPHLRDPGRPPPSSGLNPALQQHLPAARRPRDEASTPARGVAETAAGDGHGAGPCVRGSGRPDPEAGRRAAERQRRAGEALRFGAEGMRSAALYASHNDAGTATLLAAMERAAVPRLVLGSSVAVYGEGRYRGQHSGPFYPGLRRRSDLDRGMYDHRAPRSGEVLTWEPVLEDAPLRPRSAYAASKVAQEHYALAWVANTGGDAAVLRYHHLYGDPVADGRHVRSAESGVVARFRAELRAGRQLRVFEDGGQVRDFVHVRDAAVATVAAVERPLAGFVPLNIASGRPLTLWEVAATMAKAVDGPSPLVTGQCRITDIRHMVANPERARHALDFTARTPPAQGLTDYAAARGIGRR